QRMINGPPSAPVCCCGSILPSSAMNADGFLSICCLSHFVPPFSARASSTISRTVPLILLGVPRLRPPRRSPGLEPRLLLFAILAVTSVLLEQSSLGIRQQSHQLNQIIELTDQAWLTA